METAEAGGPDDHQNVEAGTGRQKKGLNKYAFICALLASINSILLGYDIGVMSGAVLYIKEDLEITEVQVEVLVGILNVFSLIGSLASGKTSDYIGRRYTIVVAAATFLVGALAMGLAPNYPFLIVGRMIAGIGVGYSLMISPVYTAEISPTMKRGFLTSLPEVFIVLGILIMLGLAAVPAAVIGVGVLIMPESPRWLVMKSRYDEAKRVLLKVSDTEQEAKERLDDMIKAAKESSPSGPDDDQGPPKGNFTGEGVWKDLILKPTPAVRRMLIAAVGINFFMQASGNDAVIYYTPAVFKGAGIHRKPVLFGINVVMGLAKTFFVVLSALHLDKFGRRPLLLLGSSGMVGSLLLLGIGSKILEGSTPTVVVVLCIIAVCAFVSFFSIGLGPITWVYSSEIFPLRLRAQGSALAISVNRLVSGVISMTFLSISHRLSFGGTFFLLAGITTVGTIFFYVFLPETKGKTLEEMQALFGGDNDDTSRDENEKQQTETSEK
ncbi:MFS domain-containing protein [Citrus sinensis]|uniref:MFS domain-containing protein n=1 Tax=Citrus sinensis TaxID=2711 RepID=A0ACB8NS10_CITSI|nr:MFS domain-containing protein [Citrus sinensis]KAH9800651.1 MFS domain-containing protein [Citrus sinensis]